MPSYKNADPVAMEKKLWLWHNAIHLRRSYDGDIMAYLRAPVFLELVDRQGKIVEVFSVVGKTGTISLWQGQDFDYSE